MSAAMMRLVVSSCLLAVLAVSVSESSAFEQQFQTFTRYGKRGPSDLDGKQLFFTNSRYGKRAPGPMGNMVRLWSGRPKGNVQPRADKFFINSRYGKRSPPPPVPHSGTKEEIYPELTESPAIHLDAASGQALICKFTGYNHLYQCIERKDAAGGGGESATRDAHESSEENQSNE